MASGNFTEGLARVSSKEMTNQKGGRGADAATPKISGPVTSGIKSNPVNGGGINRATKK